VKEEEQRDKKERERTGNWKVVETSTPPLHLIVGDDGVAWSLGVGFMALGTLMAGIALVLFVTAARRARTPSP